MPFIQRRIGAERVHDQIPFIFVQTAPAQKWPVLTLKVLSLMTGLNLTCFPGLTVTPCCFLHRLTLLLRDFGFRHSEGGINPSTGLVPFFQARFSRRTLSQLRDGILWKTISPIGLVVNGAFRLHQPNRAYKLVNVQHRVDLSNPRPLGNNYFHFPPCFLFHNVAA